MRLRVVSVSLGELFSGSAVYNAPAFQRPFDWGAEEALQLIDDVSRAAGIDAPELADPDYFLGTLLLLTDAANPPPGAAKSPKAARITYEIIDGQQRLTTLTMLFAILRDLEEEGRELANVLSYMIQLPEPSFRAAVIRVPNYRVTLNGADRNLFQRIVQRPGSTLLDDEAANREDAEAASKVSLVREVLLASLAQYSAAQREQLARFLIENCHVVVTLSEDIDRAHRLFTVLNDRGKPLRRNDIIKVEVLGGLTEADGEYARRSWEDAERWLGEGFETFFSHLKVLHGRRRNSVVTGLRSVINEAGGARPFIDEVLLPYASVYARIRSCRAGPAPVGDELSLHLHYLARLKGEEWGPPVMAALKTHADDPKTALALVRAIDRMAHIMRVLCMGSGRRTTRLNRATQAILSGAARDETAPEFAFTREEIRNAKFNMRILHRRNQPICKLLLMRINDRLQGSVSLVDPASLSVEHVLPNRPSANSGWRVLFSEPEVREAVTQCLGNLTLLPDKLNDQIRNRDFQEKREQIAAYFGEGEMMEIVRDVVMSKGWDFDTVSRRERRFLSALNEILGLDVGDVAIDGKGSAQDAAE